jgi:hypothetical protein
MAWSTHAYVSGYDNSVIGSEEHFRLALGPERAQALLNPLQKASEIAREISTAHGFTETRTEPSVAFDVALQLLSDFDQLAGVRKVCIQGQHMWVIDNTYALRVKKFREGYTTSNAQTAQQRKIANFIPLDGMEPVIYVTAGTRYSRTTGLPVEQVIVKHYRDAKGHQRVEWVIDLEQLAAGGTEPTTPILPLAPTPVAPAAVLPLRPNVDRQDSGS